MKRLRSLAVAGVVGATTLGSGLIADLLGVTDQGAFGQTWPARGPSAFAAPSGYAPAPAYISLPNHYAPAYHATSAGYQAAAGYQPVPAYNTTPAFQTTPAHVAASGYPPLSASAASASGMVYAAGAYGPTLPQPMPAAYPSSGPQPAWSYAQAGEGQASVLLGRSELLGGPPLASPQVQLPAPSPTPAQPAPPYQTPLQQAPQAPMYQAPSTGLQPQAMPGNAAPGYMIPSYAAPNYGGTGFDAFGYTAPGYAAPDCAAPGYGYALPGYPGAEADYWGGGCGPGYGVPVIRNWFASAGGLVMTRDRGDHFTFSYGTGNEADQRTNTRDASMDWAGGFDVRLGRYFNCQQNAIEAVYWSIYPDRASTQTTSANVLGNLNGIFNWNSLNYGGTTADVFVNVAPGFDGIHTLTREYGFHNLEFNLWRFCGPCATGKCATSRLRSNWLIGVRYFRFDENLLFASDANDWYITHENDEIFYNIDIENHLVGFQIGNEAQYCLSHRLSAALGLKLGIYGNHVNHISEIGGNLGVARINNGPFIDEQFYINNSKKDVAFLGELNLGLRYCFTCCWTGTIGYRALAVTGVAMPADQIYPDLRGINDVENIDSSRGLILHGGYAGLEYNW